MLILYFASLLDVLIFGVRPSKVYFSGCQFQDSLSRLAKVSKLISLCNLHPRTTNYAGVFLTRVFLLKQPIKIYFRSVFTLRVSNNSR